MLTIEYEFMRLCYYENQNICIYFFCFVTLELDIWIYLFLFQTIVVSNRDKNNKKIEDGLISTKIGIQFCKIVNGRKLILLNVNIVIL